MELGLAMVIIRVEEYPTKCPQSMYIVRHQATLWKIKV